MISSWISWIHNKNITPQVRNQSSESSSRKNESMALCIPLWTEIHAKAAKLSLHLRILCPATACCSFCSPFITSCVPCNHGPLSMLDHSDRGSAARISRYATGLSNSWTLSGISIGRGEECTRRNFLRVWWKHDWRNDWSASQTGRCRTPSSQGSPLIPSGWCHALSRDRQIPPTIWAWTMSLSWFCKPRSMRIGSRRGSNPT